MGGVTRPHLHNDVRGLRGAGEHNPEEVSHLEKDFEDIAEHLWSRWDGYMYMYMYV